MVLQIQEDSKLYDTKNMFLFSYFCWGINLFDVAQLQWTNIINGQLEYTRSKTGENFTIKLIPQAIEILDYYRTYRANDYIFPILSKDRHQSAVTIKNRYKKKLREFNLKLKEIAKLSNITTNLTSYVARHSFATALKRSGTSTSKISDMMGTPSRGINLKILPKFTWENLIMKYCIKNL